MRGDTKVVHARLLVCHGVVVISRGVGKVQSAVGHMGERKEETRERGTRVHGDVGGEGEIEAVRHKPAQDWVILRYHVLRITVPIHVCVYVYLTVCTCTGRQPQHTPLSVVSLLPFSPFPSFSGPSSLFSLVLLSLALSHVFPPPTEG